MSQEPNPAFNERLPDVVSGLLVFVSKALHQLEVRSPADAVEPELLDSLQVLNLNQVDADDVIYSIAFGDRRWSARPWSFIRLTRFTPEVLFDPSNNFWVAVSSSEQTHEVHLRRVSCVVVGEFQVSSLLRGRLPIFFGNFVIAVTDLFHVKIFFLELVVTEVVVSSVIDEISKSVEDISTLVYQSFTADNLYRGYYDFSVGVP